MKYIGEFTALLTAISWAVTSIIFTEASRKIGSSTVNIMRLIFALTILTLIVLLSGMDLQIKNEQIFYLAISGLFGLLLGDSFLYLAYKLIGARLGALLMSLAPAISAVVGYFYLNEVLGIWGIIGIFVTIIGIALVVLQKDNPSETKKYIDKRGIIYGVIAAFGQAVGLILSKKAFEFGDLNSSYAALIRLAFATVFLIPIVSKFKDFQNPVKLIEKGYSYKVYFLVLAGAIFGPVIGITLSLYSVAHTKVAVASAIMATVPIILLPMVKLYYKENLNYKSVIGAIIAVLGVVILFIR